MTSLLLSYDWQSLCIIIIGIMMMPLLIVISYSQSVIVSSLLLGIFSILNVLIYCLMNAPDVAFTEATVGASISTLFVLSAISLTNKATGPKLANLVVALTVVIALGFIMSLAILDGPFYGSVDAPIHHHVANRYIHSTTSEIGIKSVVTAVLASYRGLDTLGEITVIAIAAICVLAILGLSYNNKADNKSYDYYKAEVPIRTTVKYIIPFILLYGFYVLMNGENSPGGAFQAGVIFATSLILFAMVFGIEQFIQKITINYFKFSIVAGVMLYVLIGIASMLRGGNFLEYNLLFSYPLQGQIWSIMIIEIAITLVVSSSLTLIFLIFNKYIKQN